jgi:Tol biopolymer transport system component
MLVLVLGALGLGRWIDSPQLAYLREYRKIHLMDIERRVSFPLVDSLTDIPANLAWSPDGRYLSYVRLQSNQGYTLYLVDLYSERHSQLIAVLDSSALLTTWSPDSTQLTYVPQPDLLCLYTLASVLHTCYSADIDQSPDWSPVGSQIAYLAPRSQQIMLFDPTTRQHTALLDAPEIGTMASLRWSHDGNALVFTQNGLDLAADLYTVSVSNALTQPQYVARQITIGSSYGMRWSPDDRWLAYQAIRGRTNLYVYDTVNSQEIALTNDNASKGAIEWVKDGDMLIYVSNKRGFPEIYFQSFTPDGEQLLPAPAVPIDVLVSLYGIAPRP